MNATKRCLNTLILLSIPLFSLPVAAEEMISSRLPEVICREVNPQGQEVLSLQVFPGTSDASSRVVKIFSQTQGEQPQLTHKIEARKLQNVKPGLHGTPMTYVGEGFKLQVFTIYLVDSYWKYRSALTMRLEGQRDQREVYCRLPY